MNSKVKVSIITVCYNCSNVIEKTINSVLSQDYPNIEYIIVDGKSNDSTLDIINKYHNKIDKVISESDKGVYDAMNKGVRLASGDWVLFMNAGDVFYSSDTVSMAFQCEISTNVEILFGDTQNDNKGQLRVIKYGDLKRHKYMPSCHQSIFVKRETLLMDPFDLDYKIAADYLFFYNCTKRGVVKQYVPIIISIYDVSGGVSHNAYRYSLETSKIEYSPYFWKLVFVYRYLLLKCKQVVKNVIKCK